jgi:hypothetical protein
VAECRDIGQLGLDRDLDLIGIIQMNDHYASVKSVALTWFSDENLRRYIVVLFLAHKKAELSWNRSYLGYIERFVYVSVKLDYNVKVSASQLKELI